MAKKKRKVNRTGQGAGKVEKKRHLSNKQYVIICFAVIVVTIFGYLFPIAFEGKEPPASDSIAWRGSAQSILEAREELDTTPLWANNIFAGMPSYLISLPAPFHQPARYVIDLATEIFDWRVVYYLIGALGMFLLMRFWKIPYLASLFTSLAFVWWPHIIGLMEAGHNTKVRTIMLVPFILLTFLRLMQTPGLLNAALFSISLSLGILANHYQIIFYVGLVLLTLSIKVLIQLIREKAWKGIGQRVGLGVVAIALAAGTAAFPTMLVSEYTKYSIRGGTGATDSEGLSFEYATNWSFYPGELFTFVIPRFYGGASAEHYEGDAVPELRGKQIPGYWGPMPFTSNTHYFGVVAMFMAVLALVLRFKDRLVLSLTILLLFALILSFGKHFPLLYQMFFDYVPFFNKFRVPSMIIVLAQWVLAILAGIGLAQLLSESKSHAYQKLLRSSLIVLGIFVVIGLTPFLFKGAFAFARPEEAQRFKPEVLAMLKNARYDLMKQDALRMLLLTGATFALVLAYLKGVLGRSIFGFVIVGLLVLDLFSVDNRFMQTLVDKEDIEAHFEETPTDAFLTQDDSRYRILPLGQLYGDNRWSYRHESIGGYHPAKLRIMQDINESCLYAGTAPGFQNSQNAPLNWNVLNMLNVKYVLAQGQLSHPNLVRVFEDQQNRILVYENRAYLPRLFCVDSTEVITGRQQRLARLNDAEFDPGKTAILESELPVAEQLADTCQASITRYEPNIIVAEVQAPGQTLLVLSEAYYPAGWKAFIDGQETRIFKTNHMLRSILLPAGEHRVEFRLEPESFEASLWIKGVSVGILYLVLILALLPHLKTLISKKANS